MRRWQVYPCEGLEEWITQVGPCRHPAEQNLELGLKPSGSLYFRAVRDIAAGEELLAWFSAELADLLHFPFVPSTLLEGNAFFWVSGELRYVCVLCQSLFRYPNPVIGHLLYRCPKRRRSQRVKNFDIATLTSLPDGGESKRSSGEASSAFSTVARAPLAPSAPPLGALLPFVPPSLAALTLPTQNWCAKCNATFRMTSDLVYHMRSHHKRDSASSELSQRRRGTEKLRCHICSEGFRERHHLTRHMTSHQ
ncbi:PRDM8 [Cordylochernes scorpioides]|uniref:PRDM8 n=1 Tax=Cordylochernes scorpioides TaxID=51811 RepID=A0ABY6LUZ7_9ARAC|nr:PRDM8 [Cordylochernes scorpioides]